jgi:hypothetical protein
MQWLCSFNAAQPFQQVVDYLLVGGTQGRPLGWWCGRSQPFAFQHQAEEILVACTSAMANLSTSCRMPSSRLEILRRLPFSVTTTGSFSTLEKFFDPAAARAGCRTGHF